MNPKLSIFLPVYNEEENLDRLNRKIFEAMAALGHSFEVIYVDDGSRDRSVELVREAAAADPRFVLLELSRNFGFQSALSAGLAHAEDSDAVVTMDAAHTVIPRGAVAIDGARIVAVEAKARGVLVTALPGLKPPVCERPGRTITRLLPIDENSLRT